MSCLCPDAEVEQRIRAFIGKNGYWFTGSTEPLLVGQLIDGHSFSCSVEDICRAVWQIIAPASFDEILATGLPLYPSDSRVTHWYRMEVLD